MENQSDTLMPQPDDTPRTDDCTTGNRSAAATDDQETTGPPAVAANDLHDPDAGWGKKTRKDGRKESFYGYEEHTLVQTPHGDCASDAEPRLIVRFEITSASTDVVEPSLSLLDRLNRPAEVLSADRHYHYKKVERWRDQLADRGIRPVHDLRSDEHGFTDLNHTRWAAGWPHCPATSDEYAIIERPPPGASNDDKKKFKKRLAERFAFAFRRVTSPDARGIARWECPAVAGKVGCPLRDGTVQAAIALGLPIVENPPDPADPDFPTCCAQRTVTLDPGPLRKLMQDDYWGADDWEQEWNKRTYVEGSYGNRKNPSTENLRRGHFRVTGLTLVNVVTAMAAAAYNLRMLRNWHERSGKGDPDHPLLEAEQETFGYLRLTREQYEAFVRDYLETDDEAA